MNADKILVSFMGFRKLIYDKMNRSYLIELGGLLEPAFKAPNKVLCLSVGVNGLLVLTGLVDISARASLTISALVFNRQLVDLW